jgi:hypothetical protein
LGSYRGNFNFTNCVFSGPLPTGGGLTFTECSANVGGLTTIPLPLLNTRPCPAASEVPTEVPFPTSSLRRTPTPTPAATRTLGPVATRPRPICIRQRCQR